jgi:chromosome segregation ATPase
LLARAAFTVVGKGREGRVMGSLLEELERREAEARAEAEELRGRIAELAQRLAVAEERLARLVITRETLPVTSRRSAAEEKHGSEYRGSASTRRRHAHDPRSAGAPDGTAWLC